METRRRKFPGLFPTGAFLSALLVISGCRAEGIFYYPNRRLYADPHNVGLEYELVRYPSLNGRTLTGLYFPTPQSPRGIVVHFHGNFGNVSNHFPLSVFFLKHGFDVLVFDYQGYGGSAGKPSPRRTVEDGLASVRYAQSRLRVGGVVVFGQSLGAAVAAVVAAKESRVRAVVLEAGFTTYRDITRAVMRRSFLLWPLSFVLPAVLVRRREDPLDYIDRISPRPVLIIHGAADKVIPVEMARVLYDHAKEPKRLWIIDGGEHLGTRRQMGERYEKEIVSFFSKALTDVKD